MASKIYNEFDVLKNKDNLYLVSKVQNKKLITTDAQGKAKIFHNDELSPIIKVFDSTKLDVTEGYEKLRDLFKELSTHQWFFQNANYLFRDAKTESKQSNNLLAHRKERTAFGLIRCWQEYFPKKVNEEQTFLKISDNVHFELCNWFFNPFFYKILIIRVNSCGFFFLCCM
ncbi:hypothetical protein RFI_17546 [Reticulomyxa filosa]|uniref:Uncharacterized protein n=1 Tax=Reticulomyxa filosa TaxID=46433 RepID=X6N0T0_RETFI|nr:hypothetical protein RFI_17546 [Reticulomyxa filosa]|eukprot:ETO19686.1 hypothetical protein RFI_17546 [Reticulomyxa filosa]